MNLCRCEQGHFYDKEKYASCPHCAGGSASDEKRTEAFTEDFTVPLMGEKANEAMPSPEKSGVFPDFSSMADRSADQAAVNMRSVPADNPTVPLAGGFPFAENAGADGFGEDSDDHTVGFFDEIFPGASDTAGRPSVRQTVPKAVVNKVDTPCVGWLVALGGEHIGTDFRLKVGKNFIGRSPKMDIALIEDKSVSRDSHAIVIYEPKAHIYLVQPGESSSLVYRNNEVLLTPMKLEAYDTVTVGDVDLLFMPLCGERFNWEDILKKMKNENN